jgi:hypothetical protein
MLAQARPADPEKSRSGAIVAGATRRQRHDARYRSRAERFGYEAERRQVIRRHLECAPRPSQRHGASPASEFGYPLHGLPILTMVRGSVVMERRVLANEFSPGRYLARKAA